MNERIQELAEQADLFADSKLLMKGEFHPDWHDIRDERFATLIVLECANQCLSDDCMRILNHMGVKYD